MRIVVDIGHPAHVHVMRNFIREMEGRGHQVLVTATRKDVAIDLLDRYRIPHQNLGQMGRTLPEKLLFLPVSDYRMLRAVRKFRPDIFMGVGSLRAAHVAWLLRKPSVNFEDTEHSMEQIRLYLPFVSAVCTPSSFTRDLGKKQVRYRGTHELAYLHPEWFRPDPSVLEELGLGAAESFFIIRLAAFTATHDTRSEHFRREYLPQLLRKLEREGRILISTEKPLEKSLQQYLFPLPPDRYHHAMAYARFYIGESSTSAEEAAVLGTPALNFERIMEGGVPHSFAEYSGLLTELQDRYGLVFCFHSEEALLERLDQLLAQGASAVREEWRKKQARFLSEKINVTRFMMWFVEEFPESFRAMKADPDIQNRFR
jgi:predicted glycosyltransferase